MREALKGASKGNRHKSYQVWTKSIAADLTGGTIWGEGGTKELNGQRNNL